MLKIVKCDRRPLEVEGVQVTPDNMAEVAAWCGGDVISQEPYQPYIKVPVMHPSNEGQTRAPAGTWVLLSDRGFKVYTNRSLKNTFVIRENDGNQNQQNLFESQEDLTD